MKEYPIILEYAKRKNQTAQKKVLVENIKPDLLKRIFTVDNPDKVWVTDITYITLKNKRLLLSTMLDLYDRQILSYKIHTIKDIPLVISILTTARLLWYNTKNSIIYSNQGFQYTSNKYQM